MAKKETKVHTGFRLSKNNYFISLSDLFISLTKKV